MDPRDSLARFIRYVMRDTLYLATYECSVERQHDDHSLDLLPDDPRVRGTGLAHVPIRHGLPGVVVRVRTGSRILLGFEAGDPRRPYAALWSSSAIDSISFDGGDAPVARKGDPVVCFWPPSVPVSGTLSGLPFTGTMTITSPAPGIIQDGAKRVFA